MAKRPNLSTVAKQFDKRAQAKPEPLQATQADRPPARQGRKAITVWVEPEAWQQIRLLGFEQDKSVQTLMVEAINLLLSEQGKPPIAK